MIKVGKKYITIIPKPVEDKFNGLHIEFDKETEYNTKFATADIVKGKNRYSLPVDPRKISKVWIE